MLKVGECYYHNGINHIVIASAKKDNKFLILSITSGNFDKSCQIEPNELIDNNNQEILNHTSYICYKYAFEFESYKTYEKFRKEYEYRCKITPELLKKIQEGARKSQYLQYKFKKYF